MSQPTYWGVPRSSSGPPVVTNMPDLMTEVDKSFDALLSMHSGLVRPEYADKGTLWLDISVSPHIVKLYTGTEDAVIGSVNPLTGAWTIAGLGTSIAGLGASQTFTGNNNFIGNNTYGQPYYIGTIDIPALGPSVAYTVPNLGAYKSLLLSGYAISTSGATPGIGLRLSADNGANVIFSPNSYYGSGITASGSSSFYDTSLVLSVEATSGIGFNARLDFFNVGTPTIMSCFSDSLADPTKASIWWGRRNIQEAHNAFQIFSPSTITAGAIYIMGWK